MEKLILDKGVIECPPFSGCYKVLSIRLFTAFPLLQLYYYSIFVSVFIPAANQTVKPFRSKGQLVFKNNTMIVQIGMFEDV